MKKCIDCGEPTKGARCQVHELQHRYYGGSRVESVKAEMSDEIVKANDAQCVAACLSWLSKRAVLAMLLIAVIAGSCAVQSGSRAERRNALSVSEQVAMYGTARRDGTNVWICWSNVPAAVVVQQASDLMNWSNVLVLSRVGSRTGFLVFEYPTRGESNAAALYRLREIPQMQLP